VSNQPSATSSNILASELDVIPEIEEVFEYGLRVDTFAMHKGIIAQNEFVSDILNRFKVDNQTIHNLAINSADIFDFKKFRAGNEYTILASEESDSIAHYMIYEKDPIEYVVYNLNNVDDIQLKKRPTTRKQRQITGSIEGSLWNTLIASEIDPDVAVNLAQVYQWSIDFSRIQAGDQFNAIYDEIYVDGQYYRSDSIKASYFNHGDKEYYAFYFDQGEGKQAGFYDETGESLKRAFLRAPVKFSRISSRYSKRRFHPVQKRYKAHLGTDYAAAHGTPIVATGDGVVEIAAYTSGNGRYVKVKHPGAYKTQYLHMSKFASGIKSGKAVRQGDVIGYVGSTGLATGPHVCYRFWKNGVQVDHLRLDIPAGDPIDEENMLAYQKVKEEYMLRLKSQREQDNENTFVTTASLLQ